MRPISKALPTACLMVLGVILGGMFLEFARSRHFIPENGTFEIEGGGTGIKITAKTPNGWKTVQIINVPAYRMATPTGILIEPGDMVEIRASGTISTGGIYDWFNTPGSSNSEPNELTKFGFNRDANPSWRRPDGKRLFGLDTALDSDEDLFSSDDAFELALHKAHENAKLAPNRNYGLILGCIIETNEVERKIIDQDNIRLIKAVTSIPKTNLFAIGAGTKFQCLSEGGKRYLYFPNPYNYTNGGYEPEAIPMTTHKGELILLVNDVVLTRDVLESLIQTCLASNHIREANSYLMASNIFSSLLAKKMTNKSIDFDSFAKELWYWDNIGNFTVTIKKSKTTSNYLDEPEQ